MPFRIQSRAFSESDHIPQRYTGEGGDVSPPLEWADLPDGTEELALLVEDPDAPQDEPFIHWIAYKIPRDQNSLPEDLPHSVTVERPTHIVQGRNSFGKIGYHGPMPPKQHGPHRYFFRLYALDSPLPEIPAVDKVTLEQMIRGHVLGEASLMGTYERA